MVGADAGGRPRGGAEMAGPWSAPMDRGGGGESIGPRWTGLGPGDRLRAAGRRAWAAAPWPTPTRWPRRRYGARRAASRARACCVGYGGCDARIGHSGERPGRGGHAAASISGEATRCAERGRARAKSTDAFAVHVRTTEGPHLDENDGEAASSTARMAAAAVKVDEFGARVSWLGVRLGFQGARAGGGRGLFIGTRNIGRHVKGPMARGG